MADRASVNQRIQIGKETDYGTAVAADVRPISFGLAPRIRSESQGFTPPGYLYRTLTVQGREWSEFPIQGNADYNELIYLLASLLVEPTPTGAGDAKTWVFDPAIEGGDARSSYTVEHGDTNVDAEFAGVMVSALTLELTRRGFSVQGSAIGQVIDTDGGLTAAISAGSPVPIEPKNTDIYLDTTSAGLGGTQLENVMRVRWQFGDTKNPFWPLVSANGSFGSLIEGSPDAKVSILAMADATAMAYLAQLRSGDNLFLRAGGTSDVLAEAAATYYSWQFDTCLEIEDISEFRDEDRVYAVEFTGALAYDGTWEKALNWQLVNTLAGV